MLAHLIRSFALVALFALAPAYAQPTADSLLVDVPATTAPSIQKPANPNPAIPAAPPPANPEREKAAPAQENRAAAHQPEAAPSQSEIEPQHKIMPLATNGGGPDESALRYYASLQQTQRVETEIKRLKRLYPDWRPPENIYNTPTAGGVDEQPFWDLFAQGKLVELHASIRKRMKQEPGWEPSADLMDKVRRKETRLSIAAFWKTGKFKDIIEFVRKNQAAVGSDTDIDILWTIAEAYAKVKQTTDALNAYKSILKSNREADKRLATFQKAMANLRMSDVEELIALAHRDGSGRSELHSIALDITRGRISAYLHDERQERIPDDEMRAFEEFAQKSADPNQAGLVAWYNYKNKAFSVALEWFKYAITKGGDAMIAHGLAHSLRELGMYRDTEEVAYAWREPLVNNAVLFIDILERDLTKEIPPYIEPARLLRYAQVTMDSASGEGAQGLAWYAYNSCQFGVALEWFERAVAWLPKEATVYGYALTLQKLKKSKEFWDVLNRYDGLFPKVVEIVYPDDFYHPPTPCDLVDGNSPRAQQRKNFTVPAPYMPGQPYAGGAFAPAAATYGGAPAYPSATPVAPIIGPAPVVTAAAQIPAPPLQGQAGYYQDPNRIYRREPRIDRKLFPVSVDPQNPLRYFPTGRYMGPQAPAAAAMIAQPSPLINEPPLGMRQIVARRVPDVGPMPYERWGYTLLPGYNGLNVANGPHSGAKAPAGTLWATLQAKDAQATQGGAFDALRQDLAALVQRMRSIPPVPPPGASINGPWTSPKPYKSRERQEAEGLLTQLSSSAATTSPDQSSPMPGASPLPANARADVRPAPAPPRLQTSDAHAQPEQTRQPEIMHPPKPRVESHARDALGKQAEDFYNSRQYLQALDVLDRRAQMAPESVDLRLIRAWSLLNLNRVDEARRVFGALPAAKQRRADNHDPKIARNR